VSPLVRALAAWPMVLAQVMIFGTGFFSLIVAAGADAQAESLTYTPLWRRLAVLAFVASPIFLLVNTTSMADVSLRAAIPFLPQVVRQTHLGAVWLWSFPVTIILLIVTWLPSAGAIKTATLCALAGALLLLGSISGHAIDKGNIAVAIYFVHEVAAALWIGAIVGLWLGVVSGRLGADWVRLTAPRVSRLAGWTVAILILSGLYTAYYALGEDPNRLIYALYGRILVLKICAASLVLLIGAYNRYFLLPKLAEAPSRDALLRNVGLESTLLIGILGIAALLANTPPAH
jgi:putative copper export protein